MRWARFKAAAVETDERAGARAEALPLLSVSQTRGVIRRSEISDDPPRADDLSTYKLVTRNDIVLNRMSAFKGAVGVAAEDGICSPDYAVLQARDGWSPRYLGRLMASHWFVGEMSARLRGIGSVDGANVRTPRITVADLGNIAVPVLSVARQESIADFLDRETAEIDAFIADQRKLVTLIRERRRAAIREATKTGGFKAVAGDVWTRDAPASWRLTPVRAVLSERRHLVGERHAETTLLSLTKSGIVERDLSDNRGKIPASFESYQFVAPDDFVFCLFDIDETPRTVGLVHQHGMVTGAYTRFRVNRRVADPRFLEAMFTAIDDGKLLRPHYTGLRKVVQIPRFLSLKLALPAIEEQREIASLLMKELTEFDSAVADAESAAVLASERRAALISNAVSGNISVTA